MYSSIKYFLVITGIVALGCTKREDNKASKAEDITKADTTKTVKQDTSLLKEIIGPKLVDNFLIRDKKVGYIQLGQTVNNLSIPEGYRVEPMKVRNKAGMTEVYFAIKTTDSEKPLVTIKTDCFKPECPIIDVFVSDPNFSTSSGISVGASFKQVQTFYTVTDLHANDFGNIYVYVEENPNISFELYGLKDVYHNQRYPIEDVPAGTLISKIRLSAPE